MARTPTVTPTITREITQIMQTGVAGYRAAEAVGIPKTTYYRWLELGADNPDLVDHDDHTTRELREIADARGITWRPSWPKPRLADAINADNPYREFWESIQKASAVAEVTLHQIVYRAAFDGDWKAAMTILERRHPERYARRQIVGLAPAAEALETPDEKIAAGRERLKLIQGGAG